MSQDYKIVLKTIADMTGASKLGRWLLTHSKTVRDLARLYTQLKAIGGAAFHAIAGAANKAKWAAAGVAGALGLATREAVANNVKLAQAVNMFDGNLGTWRKFRSEIRGVSADTGIAQQELLGALYMIGSARVPKENAISLLRVAANAFIADGAPMESVIRGIASVLGPFKMKHEDAGIAADKLYTIVKGGQTTFEEVGSQFNEAASDAAAAGVTFEQLAAGVTTLTAATVKTPKAVLSLRNIIGTLNQELGDGWTKTKSLQQALEDFAKGKGYSQSKLQKIFGRETAGAVMLMVGKNAQAAADALAEMQASTGEGLVKAAAMVDQFRHWDRLTKTIKGAYDAVGEVFDRVIAPLVERISASVKSWSSNSNAFASLEARLIRIRDVVMGVIDAAQDPGKREEILGGVKSMLSGAFEAGAGVFVALFAKAVPLLAHTFVAAAKESLGGIGAWANRRDDVQEGLYNSGQITWAQRHMPGLFGTKESAAKIDAGYNAQLRADLGAKGQTAADDVMATLGAGGVRMQAGWSQLERVAAQSRALEAAAKAATAAQADATAAAAAAFDAQADANRKAAGQIKTTMSKR